MMKVILFFVGLIALCSSTISFTSNDPNVLARIYDNYTQVYRPAAVKSVVNNDHNLEQYRFFFTEEEYENIDDDSFNLLYVNVVDRTVIYHSNPNFETVGTRYLYRLNPNDVSPIEIELVNVENRLFRNVQQPTQYFYITSFENLIYLNQAPMQPYYEVTFLTNGTTVSNKAPLLSYIDQSISYTTRYTLNLPMLNDDSVQGEFVAYADIENNQTYPIVLKAAELIVKDSSSNEDSLEYLREKLSNFVYNLTEDDIDYEIDTYVYQLTSPIPIVLPPQSVKSVKFLEKNLTVVPYLSLSNIFSPVNLTGNAIKTYNLTSFNNYLPLGQVRYYDQGRFAGEFVLPDLVENETHVLLTDAESDVVYRRQVQVVKSDESNHFITYVVEYTFESNKQYDVQIYFRELFQLFKNYEISHLSADLSVVSDGVEGILTVPRQGELTQVSYRVTLRDN